MDLASYVNQLKDQLSIVDVIGKAITLKKAGRNYVGLCPFHGEKTPSFTVNNEKGIFFCFGCKTGGDMIQFYIKYHQVSFKEAVDALSSMAGMPEYGWNSETDSDSKDQYSLIMEEVRQFFVYHLSQSKEGMEYLQRRNVSEQIIRQYQLGFAPADSKMLLSLFNSKKLDKEKGCYLGLLHQDQQGQHYAYYRDRIMFPILNHTGKTIGFGARAIHPEQQPKYINSPDQVLFHKGQQLYGLYQAKTSILQEHKVLITEGYLDVLSLVQYQFPFAVATLGTALTKEHTKLLSRLQADIYLCFDHDSAGEKATEKAMQTLLQQGMNAKVVHWAEAYKDPDEVVKTGGTSCFQALLDRAEPMLDYYWNRLNQRKSESSEAVKERVQQMFDMITFSSEALLHDQVIKKMAYDLHILPNLLWDQFRYKQQQEKTGFTKQSIIKQERDFDGFIPSQEGERMLLKALLDEETDWGNAIFSYIREEDFSYQLHRRMFHTLKELYPEHRCSKINELCAMEMEQDIISGIMELSILDSSFINRVSIEQVLRKTSENKKRKVTKQMMQKIKEAEANGDDENCRRLREELKKIV